MNTRQTIQKLSDAALLAQLEGLSSQETEATVEILLHLAEVEQRGLHVQEGYSSLFAYCTLGKLRYSEPAANRRIACARVVASYTEAIELLLSKEINLSTLSLVSGILSEENRADVIQGIRGKSRREVEEFVAGYRPQKQSKERITPVVVKRTGCLRTDKVCAGGLLDQVPAKPAANHCAIDGEGTAKSNQEQKLEQKNAQEEEDEQRYELKFCISSSLKKKLDQAKCVLSGKYPRGARLEDVLEEAVELLLEQRLPKRREERRAKRSLHKQARAAGKPLRRTRSIPQEIRDSVYLRDGGQCTYVSSSGVRCRETKDLEVHHNRPFAKHGSHEVENLRLLCRVHNLLEAKREYGQAHVEASIAQRRAARVFTQESELG